MNYKEISDLVMSKLVSAKGDGAWHDHMSLNTWEWPQGVAMYAMMKTYYANRDPETLKKIVAWYDMHLERGLPSRNINTTAPMLCMALLYEETHDEKYLPLIEAWAQWVMTSLPRTQEGGFQHITSDCINEEQLWDDTLYMTVMFLYRAGKALGLPAWCDEAKYQFLLHIKYLHSTKTGLWYHGFCFLGRHHFGEAYWGRGNSWFTACAVDFVEWLKQDSGEDPVCRMVLTTWKEQCEALCKLQDKETGLWHTLLDHPDSYLETSASAAIAYGLLKGVRLGLLGDEAKNCAEKAVQGIISMIQPDGTVGGVSYGTPMGWDLDFYRNVPLEATAYGQGLVFLMLTELT